MKSIDQPCRIRFANPVIIFSILFLCCCYPAASQQNKNSTALRAVRIENKIGLPNPADGKAWYLNDSCRFFYYKDMVMYQTDYPFSRYENGELVHQEIRNRYFIFKKDSAYGMEYDPKGFLKESRRFVDSVVHSIPAGQLDPFYPVFLNKDSMKLVSVTEDVQAGTLVEKYVHLPADCLNGFDTAYLHFNKHLNEIPFSMIQRFDDLKASKLHHVRLVFNAKHSQEYKVNLEKREWCFDMKEEAIIPGREDDVLTYFRKYEERS